ncbi:hypothetical protein IC615_08730 [Serratia ureilytica]
MFASNALRLDERRGLLWGNSPDFLSGGKSRANRIYALNVADGTLNRSLALPTGKWATISCSAQTVRCT